MKDIIIMLLSLGGLAGVAFFVSSYIGTPFKVRDTVHKLFQKKKKENIDEIETNKNTVIKKVMTSEQVSTETKEKIKNIKLEADKEIVKILQKDNMESILVSDGELWKW